MKLYSIRCTTGPIIQRRIVVAGTRCIYTYTVQIGTVIWHFGLQFGSKLRYVWQ